MQLIFKNILFVIPLFLLELVAAQNPVFKHMADVSNLPDVEFYDVLEDHENYIWLAANKGLYRYDGKTYQRFSHPNQKGNSLFQLSLDSNGILWCNNISGQLFYIKNNKLNLFFDASHLVKGQLSPFAISENNIRLFTTTGIYDIHRTTKKTTKIFNGFCFSSANYASTNYAFTTDIESDTKRHQVYKLEGTKTIPILEIKNSKLIQSPLLFAFKNAIFLTYKSDSENIIYFINKANNTAKKLATPKQIKEETIYNLLSFGDTYWFLTTSGIFVYDFKNGAFIFKEQLFQTESITDVELDFNNNYWFTTLDHGVFVSPNLNIRRIELEAIKSKVTTSCALSNNQFVLATNDGKLLFYNHSNHIKTLQLPGKKIIGNLFHDIEKQLLIISINASESFVMDLKTNKIIDAKNKFAVAKTFSKINKNTLFYGNYKEGIVYKNPFSLSEKKVISSNRVKASIVNNNKLFVSYINGVFKYDLNTYTALELKLNQNSLIVDAIAKTENTIWMSTQHNGLLKFENNTLSKSVISLPKPLEINTLKSDSVFLWVSTNKGLYRYHTKDHNLKFLSDQDGLNTTINDFLILKDFIVLIFPKAFYILQKNKGLFKAFKTSKIKIEAVSINDLDTLLQANYKLPYNLNKIGVSFNSNGFQSNQHVKYQYRVKQIDTSWKNIPLHTHFVNFNSLSSGTYTFELKAKNISAKTPVFATPITFIITKPFWETYWFYGLVLTSIIGVFWLYFRWRLQQKEAQRIAEIDKILIDKKITNLRLENLRSQMNPHFIFNALNSIQDYIISNEKELASSYLVKFSRLIRIYLDYSQQNEITLAEELNALKLYLELEKVRFEDELEYQISIDNLLNTNQIKVPSLFIQPYVENALKHGLLHKLNDRKLHIEAKIIQQNKLQITVEDNGIGRAHSEKLKRPNQQHKPFATKANKERVHLYKNKLKRDITITTNDLYDKNNEAAGTKVVITMPIH
ncbi:histidine kinase [Pseudalgibacter alginicilyticus]|uniref:Histidine kinase n=2 Tax=Pseudalgibacter alginicilyticus TaxID=1736674 RepID=A0A0N7HZ02_9FLAO|nr:histidine kinase [Pseudalgibacter alginicilyticus]